MSHPLTGDAPVEPQAPTFADLQVDPRIVQSLQDAGIERTFAIQALTLPIALVGSDLIGQARTGMGKTLGFGVPLLQRLAQDTGGRDDAGALAAGRAPRALVMVPTRELCVQVARDLTGAARYLGPVVTSVYGGRAYEPQIKALHDGVDVVVGTPGRLLDLANQGHLQLGGVKVLVLDEADEMLDLGFLPDMEKVLAMVPAVKQTMLFSATMPGPILTLARTFMNQPVHIRAEMPAEGATHRTTTQFVYRAHALDKVELLSRLLQARGRGLTMVFTRTKRTAQKVADELVERGFAAAAVHGDLGQGAREQALRAFRSGKVDVLVATDVAARGIDVEGVTHVVNFQCPEDEKIYVHRIGRTGRAGRTGIAVTLVDWDDVPRWKMINDALGLDFADPAETYSSSAHLFTDLDIPAGVTGRLPRAERTRAGLDAETVEDLGETGKRNRPARERSGPSRTGNGDAGHRDGRPEGAGRTRRRQRSDGPGRATETATEATTDRTAAPAAIAGPEATGPSDAAAPRRRRARRRTRGGGSQVSATAPAEGDATAL
ncbi:DEAD/DEAH box helicase [Nakamurella endophytica]|uniref:DEAD/DEAH box helicase n=1 Tax=Nakamurella endophytica TaxID=1748367 RepID=UPI003570AFF1